MRSNSSRVLISVLGLSFLLANRTLLFAAEKAPFYQGKTQRLILLPPEAPAEAMTVLRQGFTALSKDADFIADAIKTIRFHPRFEVGEQGERLFQRVSQTPPEVINFIRQYIEQANR